MEKPSHKFDQHCPEWQQWCFTQASTLDLNTRDLAALAGIPLNTFVNMRPITSVVAAGRALFKSRIQKELVDYLLLDPTLYEDPAERRHLQSLKLDALKTWAKLESKREEMAHLTAEKEQDRNLLKDLSTEELKAKAAELLK